MEISCPHCRIKLRASEEHQGKRVRCSFCKQHFVFVSSDVCADTTSMGRTMKPTCPFCGYTFGHDAPEGQLYRCPECGEFFNVGESSGKVACQKIESQEKLATPCGKLEYLEKRQSAPDIAVSGNIEVVVPDGAAGDDLPELLDARDGSCESSTLSRKRQTKAKAEVTENSTPQRRALTIKVILMASCLALLWAMMFIFLKNRSPLKTITFGDRVVFTRGDGQKFSFEISAGETLAAGGRAGRYVITNLSDRPLKMSCERVMYLPLPLKSQGEKTEFAIVFSFQDHDAPRWTVLSGRDRGMEGRRIIQEQEGFVLVDHVSSFIVLPGEQYRLAFPGPPVNVDSASNVKSYVVNRDSGYRLEAQTERLSLT